MNKKGDVILDLNVLLQKIRPCITKSPYIFISYSSADRERVWTDVLEFQNRGYNVWLDEKNVDKSKPSWKDDAINAVVGLNCRLVVFYVSKKSLSSVPCYNEMCATSSEEARHIHNGELKFICRTPHLSEQQIKDAFIGAFNRCITNKAEIIEACRAAIEGVCDTTRLEESAKLMTDECTVVAELIKKCIEENAKIVVDQAVFQEKYDALVERYETAKSQLETYQ